MTSLSLDWRCFGNGSALLESELGPHRESRSGEALDRTDGTWEGASAGDFQDGLAVRTTLGRLHAEAEVRKHAADGGSLAEPDLHRGFDESERSDGYIPASLLALARSSTVRGMRVIS